MKEFWTLCILLMTDSETVVAETIPYSNIGLTHCLWICKMVVGLGPHFLLTNIQLARSFNLCYRHKDDLIVFNNKKFGDYVKEIYPSQLTVEKANTSDDLANYLDLTFIIESNNRLYTKLYDKRDDFDFHMVNFPFLLSNIPSNP